MTHVLFWLIIALSLSFIAVCIFFLLASQKAHGEDEGVAVHAAGSIVTVRKVGHMTSVTIRGYHDHWEGSEGIELPPTPIEATRREESALYNEYMSPDTSATRKYEIADELYAMGYSLPLIPGLIEQWKREQAELQAFREKDADARAALEPTPPDFSTAGRNSLEDFVIDQDLRSVPQPDMSEPAEEEPEGIDELNL